MQHPAPQPPDEIQVLAFDVFGTVVDWHGSIAREMAANYPHVDGNAFALAWRAGYQPAMRRVMAGELPWTLIDDLHRLILDSIVSAEVFRAYKPDPRTYGGVASTFGVRPDQVMLVAAHHDDLAAVRGCGWRGLPRRILRQTINRWSAA